MNFQQLRIVRETIRRDFNLTDVAAALYTSQPGVSKHIKDLEDELGIEIFVRRGKRLLGLTPAGRELAEVVERILVDSQNLKRIADQFASRDQGQMLIATTHTQARYALPDVIKSFKNTFPKVHLGLHQGSPREIAAMVVSGEADFAIATEGLDSIPEIVTFPCYSWYHGVIVPVGHPLTQMDRLTVEALAEYPIITYQEGFTGRYQIDNAFAAARLTPDIVLSAIDADVIKTYVEVGLGIGIIASMAFNPGRDHGLRLLDASHIFELNVTKVGLRRGHYLRDFAYRFLENLSSDLKESSVRAALSRE
ncbi:MAG TPA: CysB family HTH-type transcriptional regulator [Oligoflexus sp.]|uniref:CysB family HTH-type transcriptional regulator n=1 Tax=Oligoflexus sp. TaxID=1971216 RepID=UPI002D677E3F|nr:CysB family HTH-type transcriptional regulator [Oligoflexus sp.]HYX36122.1 CysB family HTH-type transcriptional regulator [Oligoflexus sp.]